MIEGRVNAAYEAALILTVQGPEGQAREIEAVAEFGTVRGGDEVEPGTVTMPWFEHSELTSRFLEVAYRDGWVRTDFDWPAWAQTPEAERLRDQRGAFEQANVLELARLLTVVIRSDRFAEGAVAEAIESGLVTAVLRRIEQLHREG